MNGDISGRQPALSSCTLSYVIFPFPIWTGGLLKWGFPLSSCHILPKVKWFSEVMLVKHLTCEFGKSSKFGIDSLFFDDDEKMPSQGRQEKGWLLYLRSLPRGMTNNSARPLFPKLSRYKQIVIVKLLNFGQFASFIREQKSRQKHLPWPSNSEEEFWTLKLPLCDLCDCSNTSEKVAEGTQKEEAWTLDIEIATLDPLFWHRPVWCWLLRVTWNVYSMLSDHPAL